MKSPPELWAELSELESLARHLGEFGEIRITKVDPESRVEWEADRASGTVRLEPTGWGTRVVFTVDTPEAAPEVVPPEPEPEPEPVAVEPEPDPEPEPVVVEPDPEPEPVAVEPAPAPRRRVRRGWFARLFRRTPPPPPAPVEPVPPAVEAEAPVTLDEPVAETPEPTPAERAFGTIEWETPEAPVEEEPEPAPLRPDEAHALLTDVLDTLGAAHHRPFSRS